MHLLKSWSSLSELSHCCCYSVECVWGVVEWWVVARSPRELSAQTWENTILDVIFGRDISKLLVDRAECLSSWHEMHHLEHRHLLDVSDVAHCLELFKMACVVRQIQHEVVGVCYLQAFNTIRLMTHLGNSWLYVVFSFHESFILHSYLADNTSSVEVCFPLSPVDGGKCTSVDSGFVEELKNGLDLTELFATVVGVSGHAEST